MRAAGKKKKKKKKKKRSAMEELKGASLIIQYIVIALLILSLIGSAGSILITLYNSASNPYQTYMGPVGLYACAGFSVTMSFLALIIYVSTIHLDRSGETIIYNNIVGAELSEFKADMQLGFYMILPYIALNVQAILLVFLYVHAAYTQKREQQKPTEDAPKEIMMY
ncbi:clarin-3 [Sardina pilchardus]|uniref:clarin-3 n=1 Tax=Sardina pilchardus TaxID=27697 RepID=UPI002E11D98C